jgi:uncharacterized membrane protein YbhN (UPF0104 family)
VTKRRLLNIAKYALAAALLVWVVCSNWSPTPTKDVAALGASTVGLVASPGPAGPLVAATSALPGRAEPRGLGYVWQRHVIERQPLRFGFLLAALTLYVGAVAITLVRWHMLVRALDLELSVRDAFRYGLVGIFFNTFLPGAVGGDIVKAAALARTQNRRAAAVASVIMDRLIALWALVWFVGLLGLAFWCSGMLHGPAAAAASVITVLSLAVVAVSYTGWVLIGLLSDAGAERLAGLLGRLPLVGRTAGEFWRAAWLYRQRQRTVTWVMLLTCVSQAGFVVVFWCCAQALWAPEMGAVPSLTQHFLLVPLGLTMQALVPTPGGAGAGEWGFAALYLLFHAAEATGVLASLVQRLLSWVIGLGGYVIYLCLSPSAAPAAAPVQPAPFALAAGSTSALAG